VITTQAEMDAFDPTTTVINGNLKIDGDGSSDPIINLNNLSNVTSIVGNLEIGYNDVLTNVDSLPNVTSIGGYLNIYNNPALTNIDGLSNVTSIGGYLDILNNGSLTNCCGIQNLLNTPGAISGDVSIYGNPSECSSENEVTNIYCGMSISLINNPPCINANNGSIQVEVNRFDAGPFNYSWENTTSGEKGGGISQSEFFAIENLAIVTYDITVSEPSQDPVVQRGIVLSEILGSVFEIIDITSTNSSNNQYNGSLTLTMSGGTAPYSYNWSGQSSGSVNSINDHSYIISNLLQGTYGITVSDSGGNQ
jgi:hypothetical protein